jgi:D-sedoheptulose 7-phosphate isomerase
MIQPEEAELEGYLATTAHVVAATQCEVAGAKLPLRDGVARVINELEALNAREGTCWLIGNGGSGTIADHIATDLCLAGHRAISLSNAAMLTTMANDYGRSFSGQLQRLARNGDMLIAMSCSGESPNVIDALVEASTLFQVSMTGFVRGNRMSRLPLDVQFWSPSEDYGAVQIAHLTLLHAIVDMAGSPWRRDDRGHRP